MLKFITAITRLYAQSENLRLMCWKLLIAHLPPELETAVDKDFGNSDVMSPQAMQAWIQQRKNEGVRLEAGVRKVNLPHPFSSSA